MQLLIRALFYMVLALLVWVGDAAILSIFREGSSFLACIFVDVSILRVLVRASLSALCLIWGWHRVRPLLPAKGVLNCVVGEVDAQKRGGSAESHLRSQRLLYHALQLAAAYRLSEEEKQGLSVLCYCYDCGLVSVPIYILNREGRHTPADKEIFDRHVRYGAEIVGSIPALASAAPYILYHEEYFNGGGVHGLVGENIPLPCRIFQTVWMYDCMTYPPAGRRPLICDEALLELRYYAGTALDPEVVETFIRLMGQHTILSGAAGGAKVFTSH